jgi:K+-transporting ATPase ATPase C chain
MIAHLRAMLWLFVLTLLVCCVLYPLVLWGIGQGLFPHQADGSLIKDENGVVRGSSLLAQPFSEAKYFKPRPSAVNYDAAGSGGSNLAASNPKLRGRIAWQLGLIGRYRDNGPRHGAAVGPDVEKWFKQQVKAKRSPTQKWAETNPTLAAAWIDNSETLKAHVAEWARKHPRAVAEWKEKNKGEPKPSDLAGPFFADYARDHPGTFPGEVEEPKGSGKKVIRPATEGDEIRQVFFDTWLTENPEKIDPLTDLEQVPADLVTTSGSGLDPHITLRGAEYQLETVARARAEALGKSVAEVRRSIKELLARRQFTPLGGLVGEPLVNVLEVNRAMDAEIK